MGTTPKTAGRRRRRLVIGCAGPVFLAVGGLFLFLRSLANPLPETRADADADDLARRMEAAVDLDAWQRTGAVSWDFGGRQRHLWDRRRHLARVEWKEHSVLLDLTTRRGLAWLAGEPVPEAEASELLEQAWSFWCNDSFWLNPVAKLFDAGTERSVAKLDDGRSGLLVSYGEGGVTPGDRYLWLLDEQDRPVAWRMWTQILPVQGLEASWEGWIELTTGAWVATRHDLPVVELVLSDVQGEETLEDLVGPEDPFAPLVRLLAEADGT